MRRKFFLLIFLILFTFVVSCVPQSVAPTSDLLATVVAGTLSVIQTNTPESQTTTIPNFTPIPTLDNTFTSTPIIGKIYLTSSTENVNLRVGPGRLFQVSRVLIQGTQLELLSMASGGRWVQVRNNEGIIGWVDVRFVNGMPAPANSPHMPNWAISGVSIGTPTDVVVISGVVSNNNGPITYLGISIAQGNQFDEGFTDEAGKYYIYVPKTLKGEWSLQHHATDCRSNLMDASCQCLNNSCGSLVPQNLKLTFPLGNDSVTANFGWE